MFFARFSAIDPFPDGRVPPGDEDAKLKALHDSMSDIPNIMNTMQQALVAVVRASA